MSTPFLIGRINSRHLFRPPGQVLRREPQSIEALYVQSASLEFLGRQGEAIASYGRTLEAIDAAAARGEASQVPPSRVRARMEALEGGRAGSVEEP